MSDWLDLYSKEPESGPRGVAVYLPRGDSARRLIRLGRQFGDSLGVYVSAFGPQAGEAAGWGADKVVEGGSPAAFIERFDPEIVLFDDSDDSIEQAARLGERSARSLLGPAFEAELDPSTRQVIVRIRVYGGRQIEEVTAGEWRPQLVILEPEAL
ncbi:MAG TPA: hypothetical protein VI643_00050, partial [Planctomycetota bacterium]|nr:hypothetical protein [Planctomycetota bacterium]